MRRAVEAPGFEYAVYELGLARAYYQMGLVEQALEFVDRATELRFEGNAVRTEFERERRLAQALRVEILAANGRTDEADILRGEYVNSWGGAN